MRRFAAASVLLVLLVGGVLVGPAAAAPPQQTLLTITINVTSNANPPVVVTGAIVDTGVDVTTSNRMSGPVSHDLDDLVLTKGTIHVKDVGHDTGTATAATCTVRVSEKGVYTITGGTGAYAGIKGHGRFTAVGDIRFAGTAPACFDNAPSSGTIVVTAVGVVKR